MRDFPTPELGSEPLRVHKSIHGSLVGTPKHWWAQPTYLTHYYMHMSIPLHTKDISIHLHGNTRSGPYYYT